MSTASDAPARRGRPRTGPDPQRYQEILDAASQLFLRKGYAATSIQDIADAVGMLKGSLYYYVDAKEDFLFAIIKGAYDAAVELVEPITNSDKPALHRLTAFVHAHVRFSIENLASVAIQIRELDSLSSDRKEEITRGGDVYVSELRAILRDGQAQKLIDPDVDVRVASLGILGMLNSVVNWYHEGGSLTSEDIASHFASLIIAGIVADGVMAEAGPLSGIRARVRGEAVSEG